MKLMKTSIKLAMIGALGVLSSAATFAQPSAGDDSSAPGTPQGGPGPNRPGLEAHRKVLLEKYDANKDGKLDDAEFTVLGKDVFEGKLPPPRRGPVGPGEPRGPGFGPRGRGGPDGSGFGSPRAGGPRGEGERDFGPRGPRMGGPEQPPFGPGPRDFVRPDNEEGRKMLEEHRREFIKKYDANNDGKLDSAEREAIGKDIEDGKLPPPPPLPARREAPPKEQ
jgi:hypothetical protein